PVALREVVLAPVVHQPDAADVDGLLADADLASADIDVGVAERGEDLRYRHPVELELARVDVDVELLGRAAPRIDLDDAGNREQARYDDPVADGAQIHHTEVLRADDLAAQDLAGAAVLLHARHQPAGQVGILLQRDDGAAVGEVVIDSVLEHHADERQAV